MVTISWLEPEERLLHELRQQREEGADPGEYEDRWLLLRDSLAGEARRAAAVQLLDELAPLMVESERWQPSGPTELAPADQAPRFDRGSLTDRIAGGWTGRMAGCLLGKPVEKVGRTGIRAILTSVGEWPLRQYFTASGVPEEVLTRHPFNRGSRLNSLRENIRGMPEDDDINFPLISLQVLEEHGPGFGTDDVAAAWLRSFPALRVFTAERVVYQNLLDGLQPPATAWRRNPYREWIGAQIRAPVWGWVRPGHCQGAAELARRDACLSHVNNGVYAEEFAAAMAAAACDAVDVRDVVGRALDVVPQTSRLAEAVRFAVEATALGEWETVLDAVHERYGFYHWAHSINNSALVAAALIFGAGDFDRSITAVVMGGWDTDSNGATVGAVVGTLVGRSGIAEAWTVPLVERVSSSIPGFDGVGISELARRTVQLIPERFVLDAPPPR